jgi:endonuclease/exonuclease/phosphatase family metal-dependent hydrolase
MLFKFITWNIGAAPGKLDHANLSQAMYQVTKRSHQVADVIHFYRPDMVCLQEVISIGDKYSQTWQIAKLVEDYQYAEFVLHDLFWSSSVKARSGLAILSKYPIQNIQKKLLPNPILKHQERADTIWKTHDKGLLIAEIHCDNQPITCVSLHMLPFLRFQIERYAPQQQAVWQALDQILNTLNLKQLVVGGDFNQDNITDLLPKAAIHLHDVKFLKPTHRNTYYDHVLLHRSVREHKAKVIPAKEDFDHNPCMVEMKLELNMRG